MGLRRAIGTIFAGGSILLAAGCGATENEPDLVAGKKAFAEKCSSCHILERAGGTGTQGPNLDEAFRQALADGMERSGVEGVVRAQIQSPARVSQRDPIYMPADLVKGRDADNVAAYVAEAVSAPGEDQGLLASAVPKPGSGKPVAAENGTLEIPAATAGLAYDANAATAEAGALTIRSPNPASVPHNIALEGEGVDEVGPVVNQDGVSEIKVDVQAGEYTFYCSVEGHRAGGMEGKLTVE